MVHEDTEVLGSCKWDQLGQDLLMQPRLGGPVSTQQPGLQAPPQGPPQNGNDGRGHWGGDRKKRLSHETVVKEGAGPKLPQLGLNSPTQLTGDSGTGRGQSPRVTPSA